MGPVVGGVLFDTTKAFLIPFVFAGILCFIASGTSVVVWMMGKQREKELGLSPL
jgi:hypothetical protein